MAYEPKDGSGALFKNDKQGNDKRPDYRGDILIGGQMYSLSAWLKTASNGNKFMSLSAQPKDKQQAQKPTAKPQAPTTGSGFDDLDNDLPW